MANATLTETTVPTVAAAAVPQLSQVDQAQRVLGRLVGPFADLQLAARGSWVEVETLQLLNQHSGAARLAWKLVKEFSRQAAPRYVADAREQLAALRQDTYFADFVAEQEAVLTQAEAALAQRRWKEAIKQSRLILFAARQLVRAPETRRHLAERQRLKSQRYQQNRRDRAVRNRQSAQAGGKGR